MSLRCLFLSSQLRYSKETMKAYSHLDIGQIGERAAAEYYKRRGFKLLAKNYWKPFGEVDIILKHRGIVVFVEVKSVSCETFTERVGEEFNQAENVHQKKRARLRKVVSAYLKDHSEHGSNWRFDLALVQVNTRTRRARVEVLEDVII